MSLHQPFREGPIVILRKPNKPETITRSYRPITLLNCLGRRTNLIIDGKVTEPRRVDSGIPQGSPISPLLFLIYTSSLYRKIREAGAHVVGFIDDITIYKGGKDIDKNTATLGRVLHICHEWAQECHTEFDYGDKLGFLHTHTSKRGRPKKKKKRLPKRLTLPITGLDKRQAQKSLKLLGVTLNCVERS